MSVVLKPEMKRWLVEKAEDVLDGAGPALQMKQVSQLRNMLQVSQRDSEVPVLVNFLRYQVGRQATRRFWEPIYTKVEKNLKEIEERCKKEYDDEEQRARGVAIQHYFGFMVRHYVYLQAQQGTRHRQGGRESGPRNREWQRR